MKKTLLLFLFTIVFDSYNGCCQAQNNFLRSVVKELALQAKDINENFFVSKVLPYAKDKSILVIPKYASRTDEEYVYDAYVVVIDNSTGKILYKFYEPLAWVSDAISLSDLMIDTGLYILNNETRAFGIRATYSNNSHSDPYSRTELSLFIVENKKLKRLLKNYIVSSYNGSFGPICEGTKEEMEAIIDIDKVHQSNQFNDLVIGQTLITTDYVSKKNSPNDCYEKRSIKKKTLVMRYDSNLYK